jgi:hypothetical protein
MRAVNGHTDAEVQPKPPWRKRKEAYIAHIKDASPSASSPRQTSSTNAETILKDYHIHGDALWKRFKGGKDGTMWDYQSLVIGSCGGYILPC